MYCVLQLEWKREIDLLITDPAMWTMMDEYDPGALLGVASILILSPLLLLYEYRPDGRPRNIT